jgi:hypothetical protein
MIGAADDCDDGIRQAIAIKTLSLPRLANVIPTFHAKA